jgi:hypothetical protein
VTAPEANAGPPMSFFEPPPPRPRPPAPPWRQPAWFGPPDNLVGGVVALELLAARSDKAAVWIGSAVAYPTGTEFHIEVRWRPELFDVVQRGAPWHFQPTAAGELPDELFRAGFEFADGSKATTLGTGITGVTAGPAVAEAVPEDEAARKPRGPVLMPRGGSGGGQSWSHGLWLWPLPPPGRLSFVCEWPALGIELTRAEIPSPPIREAAARSRELWQLEGPPPP